MKRGVLAAGALPVEFPTISLGEVFLNPTSLKFRNLMSIDKVTVLPGVEGLLASLRTARPPAEVSTESTPVVPCSWVSKLCSTPSLPMYSVPR